MLSSQNLVILIVVCFTATYANGDTANSTCSMEMFGGDLSAYMACKSQFALQSNWWPSPIAGLFSYQVWNGYDGFWQNGLVLETYTNFFAFVGNNTRYQGVIKTSIRDLYQLMEAYGPYPSFDDMAWYALSYARIYEVLGWNEFLQTSIQVFDWLWQTAWDSSGMCGGGMWFDNSFEQKVTITNAECVQVAGKLYRFTKNETYLTRMNAIWNYMLHNNLVDNSSYLVHDGATPDCKGNNFIGPTYLPGTVIGGLVEFYKITNNQTYLDLANKVLKAAIANTTNSKGILTEWCDPYCNDDQKMFRGVFVRNVRYLMDVLDDEKLRQEYQDYLDFQVKANLQYNMCDKNPIDLCEIIFKDGPPYYNKSGPLFSPDWNGPFTYAAPMQQTAALDLFVAAIKPGTNCTGDYCGYNPYYPHPQPMTCKDYPCPEDQPCCEYSPYTSYTCCTSDQKCVQGVCT